LTEVTRQRKKLQSEGKRQADESKTAAHADKKAAAHEKDAARTSSASIASSKRRQAQGKRDDANKARTKAAKAAADKAKAEGDLHTAQRKLDDAREKETKKQRDRAERDRERSERRRSDQDRRAQHEQQRREAARDEEVAHLRTTTSEMAAQLHEHLQAEAPDTITVLFVAASPEDQKPLRIDREAREVLARVRESEYRDSVRFEWRPATQLSDLIQMLNEVRPHIVHFSGHGSQEALAFENDQGRTAALANEQLAAFLHATLDRIRLVVFNSCNSAAQAEFACLHLDAAIGMDEPIDDEAAQIFAGQLYNAIGFGKSLARAIEQARVHGQLVTGDESGLGEPRLHVAAGIDPSEIYLVKPPAAD